MTKPKKKPTAPTQESDARRARARDVEALHAVQQARPLRPPPYAFGPRRTTVALLAAREDRRNGVMV